MSIFTTEPAMRTSGVSTPPSVGIDLIDHEAHYLRLADDFRRRRGNEFMAKTCEKMAAEWAPR